ncbi:MAG: hypothetical protein Q8M31_18450 [Beijerinckiaceae bacterium]|nr:hypothetical protein [Beijerinckiaceae bacterium]
MTLRSEVARVFRDYVTDRVPATGEHEPVKREIRDVLGAMGDAIGALALASGGPSLTFETKAAADLSVAHDDGVSSYIWGDPDPELNGVYVLDAGAWAFAASFSTYFATEAAESARDLAREFAENAENDEVTGYTGEYSARHHAAKAAATKVSVDETAAIVAEDKATTQTNTGLAIEAATLAQEAAAAADALVYASGAVIYPSTAAGLAATSEGNYFYVPAPGVLIIYRNLSSVAVEQTRIGQPQFLAGSNAAPGITFAGDTNTGFTNPAADAIGIVTGGAERLRVLAGGNIGIGGAGSAATNVLVERQITGSTTAFGSRQLQVVQSGVTAAAYVNSTTIGTVAAAFTLPLLRHYQAGQGTIGAGSAVTTQTGFHADASLVGAAANYGFFGGIGNAANRWNFYAGGSAPNYFAGNVGIGVTVPAAKLDVDGSLRTSGVATFIRPSDHWSTSTSYYSIGSAAAPLGQLDHHGSSEVTLTSNGYRGASALWVSYAAAGNTGAAQIVAAPNGTIDFRTEAVKATGASSSVTNRMRITAAGNVGIGNIAPSTTLHVTGPIRVGSYTVATVPSASTVGAGSFIYVSNETGGATIAFSDGTNWRRLSDRAIIS